MKGGRGGRELLMVLDLDSEPFHRREAKSLCQLRAEERGRTQEETQRHRTRRKEQPHILEERRRNSGGESDEEEGSQEEL